MQRIIELLADNIKTGAGITIGSAGLGATPNLINKTILSIPLQDIVDLMQIGAFGVSIVVGVLTVISLARKNRDYKRNKNT